MSLYYHNHRSKILSLIFFCFEIIPIDKILKEDVEKQNDYKDYFLNQTFSNKILDYFEFYDNHGFTYLMKSKYLN